ncbi:MAG: carbon dioxide concentrating mechanism protein CcmL [Phycisphaeraceae bacterium]|nr:carbon dioxide concentrating mechanism protein CcmL [Phycisphaeraceae bacterium]
MRIARVHGTVTLNRSLPDLRPGRYLVANVLDRDALDGLAEEGGRATPMPESLVVFDQLGAGTGQIIAVSEGGEATMPFRPGRVPIDAYCAAIIDSIHLEPANDR